MRMSASVWDQFDVLQYVDQWYGKQVLNVDRELITGIIGVMRQLDVEPDTWRRAADVGAGPNLFPGMLLAPFVRNGTSGDGRLDLIELGQPNLTYLRDVIQGGTDSGVPTDIWDKFEQVMIGESDVWEGALNRLRRVARVMPGDVYGLPPETYDAVSSFFVAESISDSVDECRLAIAKLIAATRPGGFIMVGHMLESEGWHAGEEVFYPAVPLTVDNLREIYAGHLDSLRVIHPSLTPEVRDGYTGAAVVVGRKKSELITSKRPFTSYDIQNCLYDQRRVDYFRRAIDAVVKPGMVVANGGSGSGVLGMLAAKAGAARVYCVELNHQYVDVIEENARINGLSDVIVAMHGDASTVTLPEKVDVVISEVISGGLFYEPQLQIMDNLRRFLKAGATVIPRLMVNRLELIHAEDTLYGLTFTHDTRYHRLPGDRSLTTCETYLKVDFARETDLDVEAAATVEATETGAVNAVRVPYSLRFADGVYADEPTKFLLNPQIVFLPEPVAVVKGQRYVVEIGYRSGDSPLNARIKVTPKT
jgi:predicted RNA methylase